MQLSEHHCSQRKQHERTNLSDIQLPLEGLCEGFQALKLPLLQHDNELLCLHAGTWLAISDACWNWQARGLQRVARQETTDLRQQHAQRPAAYNKKYRVFGLRTDVHTLPILHSAKVSGGECF